MRGIARYASLAATQRACSFCIETTDATVLDRGAIDMCVQVDECVRVGAWRLFTARATCVHQPIPHWGPTRCAGVGAYFADMKLQNPPNVLEDSTRLERAGSSRALAPRSEWTDSSFLTAHTDARAEGRRSRRAVFWSRTRPGLCA